MIDHVSLGTHDLRRAADFYSAVLDVLGYRVHRRTEQEVAFGPPNEWVFFLYAAQNEQARQRLFWWIVMAQVAIIPLTRSSPN